MKYLLAALAILILTTCYARQASPGAVTDPVAERMLLYQRDNGGWAQYHGDATDYDAPPSEERKAQLLADKSLTDATLDDHSTTREIDHLLEAYADTGNEAYRTASERGIRYLLEAQYPSGGWPQQYPDTSSYHEHITYNDNAMIDALRVIQRTANATGDYAAVSADLRAKSRTALARGIDCILKTQVVQHGKLTAWCAQYDSKTLQPAAARKFEPASISGSESVGIVQFLMSLDDPSPEVDRSIRAAVEWFDAVRIDGYRVDNIKDPSQPSGRDRVLVADPDETVWARFYELETFRPIFTGRDQVIRYDLKEIENERRVGYGFYGTWPEKILEKEFPAWQARQ